MIPCLISPAIRQCLDTMVIGTVKISLDAGLICLGFTLDQNRCSTATYTHHLS